MMDKPAKRFLFKGKNGENYLFPFVLVCSLFLMWGFAHALLDVLNSHFQEVLGISKAKSAFIQFSLYGGYFVMGIPAGIILKKHGYKKGMIFGLFIFAIGAFLFYPATKIGSFLPFLFALFIIACGLTILESAANPYTTILGTPGMEARRINLAQSFNGLGWILGPLIGGMFVFSSDSNPFESLEKPYMFIGCLVLIIAILFIYIPLPQVEAETSREQSNSNSYQKSRYKDLFKHRLFTFAVIAQFLYVAAQTGIGSFFINYVVEVVPHISHKAASEMLAFGGMGMFMVGRVLGSYIMKFLPAQKLLGVYALINTILMFFVVLGLGMTSVICIFASYFFMSIMYPTIFAIGINNMGYNTEKASSVIVMSVAGGAVIPMLMGYIADGLSMSAGFIIPLVCFIGITAFGFCKLKN